MVGNRGADTAPERALAFSAARVWACASSRTAGRPDCRCRADVVFPTERIAVFVDGCFWHRCPDHGVQPDDEPVYWRAKLDRNVARDRENDEASTAAGWEVVRVWEHETPQLAAERIARLVSDSDDISLGQPARRTATRNRP